MTGTGAVTGSTMKKDFVAHLHKVYPRLEPSKTEALISENLLSPFVLELPKSVFAEAKRSIAALYALRENSLYQKSLAEELQERGLNDPGNKSICMSYDFHVNAEGNLKLIEINTNASFLALGLEMYQMRGEPLPQTDFSKQEIQNDIENELRLQGKPAKDKLEISIIDEHPQSQRLYIEFLVFHELFQTFGWNSKIQDVRECDPASSDLVYNRHTDFYFEKPESAHLKKAYLDRKSCFSPNPYEYCLLADKQRLIDWHREGALQAWQVSPQDQKQILSVVPLCMDVQPSKQTELWAERKKFFFKPKRAFGAKQSYRGASITNKTFAEIIGQEFIAQEFVPPEERTFQGPEGDIKFKYDLRCYAYEGRLQLVVARLYQGQVTNLKTPLGGFACVRFV